MSRHRNVRTLNYDEDYFDEDDVYGHSIEDNYCISPSTAAQFTFNRDKNVDLSNFLGEEGGIPEEEEYEEDSDGMPRDHHRHSLDYTRPQLNDVDEAHLNSCLEEVRNVLGESLPEHILIDTIIKQNFDLEKSLNQLLNQSDAPKPQREPRQRRNRSQGVAPVSKDTTPAVQRCTITTQVTAPTPPQPPATRVTGPTVILKTPKAKLTKTVEPPSEFEDEPENLTRNITSMEIVQDLFSTPEKASSLKSGNDSIKVSKSSQKLSTDNQNGATGDTLSTPKKERYIPPLPKSASKSKVEKFDLLEEYKKRQGGKDMINLVVIGHVDAGKSTLMGHLLYQLGNVNKRLMHKYEQDARKMGKSSFAFAWVLDETEEERARGVTMDIAQTQFETAHKSITLLDAPGHKDFIPNMITGTAQADVAILVVNATKGEFETGFESGGQTREHALLARSLGVAQIVVAVNKMDTMDWSQTRYDEIVKKLGQFLKQAGFKEADASFIPVSGLAGENLVHPVQENALADWYKGNTLVQQIDQFKPVSRAVDKPLRISVTDVFKGMGGGLTVAGKVCSGCVQAGDRVLVMPSTNYAIVKSLGMSDEAVSYAFAGDHISVVITGIDITNIGVGSMLCESKMPVQCAVRIQARIVLFNLERPITRGYTVVLHYQSMTEPAIIKRLVSQLNKSTGEVIKNKPKCLTKNSSAVIELEFEKPICVELYKDNKELGRFMLREGGHTIAAGLIEQVLQTKTDVVDNSGATGN